MAHDPLALDDAGRESDRMLRLGEPAAPGDFRASPDAADPQRTDDGPKPPVTDAASDRDSMETHYTHTTWHVTEGGEEEFVRRWSEWVEWSHRQGLAEVALLLRDVEDPRRFVSFGPWESVTAIVGWRALPGYQERVECLRRVVDGFEPRTLEVVARR